MPRKNVSPKQRKKGARLASAKQERLARVARKLNVAFRPAGSATDAPPSGAGRRSGPPRRRPALSEK